MPIFYIKMIFVIIKLNSNSNYTLKTKVLLSGFSKNYFPIGQNALSLLLRHLLVLWTNFYDIMNILKL